MYKAKCNIACETKRFVAGKEYTKKEIEGFDVNDFELVGKEEVVGVVEEATIEMKPKSMTTETFKARKTKK